MSLKTLENCPCVECCRDREVAAAERRGYETAIAKLRDRGFNGAADWLEAEATKETGS